MRQVIIIMVGAGILSSCSTLNQSFQLGGAAGMVGGGLVAYTAHSAASGKANFDQVASGAAFGLVAGLIASYFIHRSVEEDRLKQKESETEVHFGDLPPSPFIFPKQK